MPSNVMVALYELHPDLTDILVTSIRRMMSLPVVRQSTAQIIDNVPIRGQFYGRIDSNFPAHPDSVLSTSPTEEASTLASRFCDTFDPANLTLEAPTAQKLQNIKNIRQRKYEDALLFLEIVSRLIHDITSNLWDHLHPHEELPKDLDATKWRLSHKTYSFAHGFPHEMASITGYWAETAIFGGPVLLARGPDATEYKAAFIHLPVPKIAQLTEDQVLAFFAFCTKETLPIPPEEDTEIPIPFQIDLSIAPATLTIPQAIEQNVYRDEGQLSTPRDTLAAARKRFHTNEQRKKYAELLFPK